MTWLFSHWKENNYKTPLFQIPAGQPGGSGGATRDCLSSDEFLVPAEKINGLHS